jgi:adenine-specific DNA methylase
MIPKECKRLAEVDFPIAEVSRHAVREKSIRHGHPSTLHLWWARRPLASSRAVLLSLLWPDPCDPLCPAGFKREARARLRPLPGCNPGPTDADLRRALLRFIADFANWDLAANRTYLEVSRALVKAAHAPEDGGAYEPPLVVDPFAGGGSIPLEALRLGCEAFASDLNPVACLILKVMLEDIPRHGPGLADELRRAGVEIKRQAERELGDLYPKDPDGATPITYLWSRMVRCEAPNCGAEILLVRSFWLCKKAGRKRALRHRVEPPQGGPPRVDLEVFEPAADKDVPGGTVTRAKATCVCCGAVLAPGRVRAQLAARRGGADVEFDSKGRRVGGARLLAVVTLRPGETGRHYRQPTERDYAAVRAAQTRVARIQEEWELGGKQGLCPVPDEPLPPIGTLGFRVQRYGMLQWGDLFTARQKVGLCTFSRLIRDSECSPATKEPLALTLDHTVERFSSLCRWSPEPYMETVLGVFGRQALPIVWDFAESAILSESTGSFLHGLGVKAQAVQDFLVMDRRGTVQIGDARKSYLPDDSSSVWFTDPPYYDAIPYSDLSDFFFVWLKRMLPGNPLLSERREPGNGLTPKLAEIVQDETKAVDGQAKNRAWFENQMAIAFAEGRSVLRDDGVACVVFAHKTTEGWESLLAGMIRGGWTISGSWPIATERSNRPRSRESAALATSVHLVCRPRATPASVGDWANILRELPNRVGDWMERLQGEGIRGADLVFACIGPALEVFSRYARVETAEGREVKLDEYLEKVWEVVGRSALAQVLGTAEARARNGAAGAVEEDARLTALFLWTLQTTDTQETEDSGPEEEDAGGADDVDDEEGPSRGPAKGFTLVFDVVRRFAQPLGIELSRWEGRVTETKKGVVRLLPVAERAKQLFGQAGAEAVAASLERQGAAGPVSVQGLLFPEMEVPAGRRATAPKVRGRRRRGSTQDVAVSDESLVAAREATTLDRVHAAMLLQAAGRANALRALVKAEQERGPDFLRLANALSALYPKASEEKRLLDAMLLAVPR